MRNVMGKYIQNESVLLQTVTQPHKLTVAPTHTGGLLAEAHAVSLEDNKRRRHQRGGGDNNTSDPDCRHLHVSRSRSRCASASGRLSPAGGSSRRCL